MQRLHLSPEQKDWHFCRMRDMLRLVFALASPSARKRKPDTQLTKEMESSSALVHLMALQCLQTGG